MTTQAPARRDPAGRAAVADPLADRYGRRLRKLRLSLLDACNFRCVYCMPSDPQFAPFASLLTPAEIGALCGELVRLGISQVRMTGGEPTLRRDFDDIAGVLGALPLEKLGLTTNGYLLDQKLDVLEEAGCRHVNISLDSLRPHRFAEITRSDGFARVQRNLLAARARGFEVKVNVVVVRGLNDDELLDFVAFSAANTVPVRFLELMKIGPRYHEFGRMFVSADEMLARIRERYELRTQAVAADSTAFSYRTDGGAEIGFIASESKPFCHSCSRLRLSATGHLRACLMSERGIDVRGATPEQLRRAVAAVAGMKPEGRLPHIEQAMYQIGG